MGCCAKTQKQDAKPAVSAPEMILCIINAFIENASSILQNKFFRFEGKGLRGSFFAAHGRVVNKCWQARLDSLFQIIVRFRMIIISHVGMVACVVFQ